ncbi:MAG: hypothetical protein IJT11_02300 [Bacteroidaceae bacterium]|nr:hypothetical protein [Bacteroidaceae bacterium]
MSEGSQTRRMYGHDYAVPGTYEVTMVVTDRRPVFGEVVGTTRRDGEKPRLKPSALGQAVLDTEVPKIRQHYPMVDVWQVCLMPDHLHMIVRINQPLPQGKHLGIIIGAFKGGISRAWWQSTAAIACPPAPSSPAACPSSSPAACPPATVPAASAAGSASSSRQPLFEPGYNDHILMRDGQLENWKRYLRDNPLRYMMRHEYPDLFQRALCITIGGVRYSAFGNLLLLRQPEKHQVFFHRRTDGIPTESTDFWRTESRRLLEAANSGDVLVTPGISECEKRIKNMALEQRLRLIHLQATPIGRYWKPERSRFDACAAGSLLILAPWPEDMPTFESDYGRFHYLNTLAEAVCAISHKTSVGVQGLRHAHGD